MPKDRYDLSFEITRLVTTSHEPLEEIKYLASTLCDLWKMYVDREDWKVQQKLKAMK